MLIFQKGPTVFMVRGCHVDAEESSAEHKRALYNLLKDLIYF